MPGTFDGAGAFLVDASTVRVQVNHETSDASISEVDLVVSTDAITAMKFNKSAFQAAGKKYP